MDNDMLSSLLSDPDALKNAMKTVSDMLGGNSSGSAPGEEQSASQKRYDPSAELMERALPVIGSIVQKGQGAVRPEKRELLNAVKPFVDTDVARHFDHAMRLVSMARMARAALDEFGGAAASKTP